MRNRIARITIALALAAGGCGTDEPGTATDAGTVRADAGAPGVDSGAPPVGDDAGTPAVPDAGAPVEGVTTPPEGAVERLAGLYAMQTRFASIQTLPFLGDQRSVTRAYALVTIEETGGTLRFTEEGCRAEIEGGGTTMTEIPDAIARSVGPRAATLEFHEEGGAWRWTRPMIETAVGWMPAGASDALPEMATDPRVFDQDEDGNPGVTVRVSGFASGDVYVVQRQRTWYDGPIGTSGEITGENHAGGGEQRTIGASTMLLDMDVPSRADTNTEDNTVRLVPLEGEYDCDRLVSEAETLFP